MTTLNPKTILLVGGDQTVRGVLNDLASSHELLLDVVHEALECLERVEAGAYDLLLTDAETSGAEDLDLLTRIHQIRPGMKVIVIASSSTPDLVLNAIRHHAFSYFSKPFDANLLKDLVSQALGISFWTDAIEVKSAKRDWIALKVRSQRVTAERVVQFFRELKMDLPADQRENIATAFREILMNAMEHGTSFDPNQEIEISCVRTSRAIVYRIEDPGKGFSFESLPHAAISNPPGSPIDHVMYRLDHDIRPGGFGILMAKKLVDELIFSEQGNEVILIKYLA